MKRFYSLPMAIFYAIFALFFSAWLCVVVMVFKNADEFPISALIVCCLLLAVLILFCMCMVLFSLRKITITNLYVKITFLGRIITCLAVESIADIVIYNKRGANLYTVVFSESPVSEMSLRRAKKNRRSDIQFTLSQKELAHISETIDKPIKKAVR